MIDTVRTIDDIFITMVEAGTSTDLPIDDAVEDLWAAFEMGDLRLVVDGERLRVERMALACQNRPLVAARRRVLCCVYDDDDEAPGP